MSGHEYVERAKVVRSGQTRTYYAAGCTCGWQGTGFRMWRNRATDEWALHTEIEAAHVDTDGPKLAGR